MRHGTVGGATGGATAAAAAAAAGASDADAPLSDKVADTDSDTPFDVAAVDALSETAKLETALTGSFEASFCEVRVRESESRKLNESKRTKNIEIEIMQKG